MGLPPKDVNSSLPKPGSSFWVESTRGATLPESPDAMTDVDVLVLGGGIMGVTTAHLCKRAGLKVGLIEAATIAGDKSVTAYSTAKLSAQHGAS